MSGGATLELGQFARGEDLPVDPARIDAELDRLWRTIARRLREGRPGTPPVHRACLLNLVAYAPDEHAEIVARFLCALLTDRLPARVVLLRARAAAADDGPRAWVSSMTDPEQSGATHVSGELIVIGAAGRRVDTLPPLVRSVLEPDLPTTLWWAGEPPPPSPHVDALCGLADRIVVDSDAFTAGGSVAHALHGRTSERLADLAWPRLRPWRQAVARAFDLPETRPFLAAVREVEIGVGGPAGGPLAPGAALLAGWLAEALGWGACVGAEERAVCFSGRERGSLDVRVVRRTSRAPGVADVTLCADAAELRFERVPGPDRVIAHVPEGFPRVRSAPFRELAPEDVLAAAALAVHEDPIAPAATRRAAEIAAALGGAA